MNCLPVAAISSGCGSEVRPLCPSTRQLSFTATDGSIVASDRQQLVAIQWHVARYLPDKYTANAILLFAFGPFYLLLFIFLGCHFLPQRDDYQRN